MTSSVAPTFPATEQLFLTRLLRGDERTNDRQSTGEDHPSIPILPNNLSSQPSSTRRLPSSAPEVIPIRLTEHVLEEWLELAKQHRQKTNVEAFHFKLDLDRSQPALLVEVQGAPKSLDADYSNVYPINLSPEAPHTQLFQITQSSSTATTSGASNYALQPVGSKLSTKLTVNPADVAKVGSKVRGLAEKERKGRKSVLRSDDVTPVGGGSRSSSKSRLDAGTTGSSSALGHANGHSPPLSSRSTLLTPVSSKSTRMVTVATLKSNDRSPPTFSSEVVASVAQAISPQERETAVTRVVEDGIGYSPSSSTDSGHRHRGYSSSSSETTSATSATSPATSATTTTPSNTSTVVTLVEGKPTSPILAPTSSSNVINEASTQSDSRSHGSIGPKGGVMKGKESLKKEKKRDEKAKDREDKSSVSSTTTNTDVNDVDATDSGAPERAAAMAKKKKRLLSNLADDEWPDSGGGLDRMGRSKLPLPVESYTAASTPGRGRSPAGRLTPGGPALVPINRASSIPPKFSRSGNGGSRSRAQTPISSPRPISRKITTKTVAVDRGQAGAATSQLDYLNQRESSKKRGRSTSSHHSTKGGGTERWYSSSSDEEDATGDTDAEGELDDDELKNVSVHLGMKGDRNKRRRTVTQGSKVTAVGQVDSEEDRRRGAAPSPSSLKGPIKLSSHHTSSTFPQDNNISGSSAIVGGGSPLRASVTSSSTQPLSTISTNLMKVINNKASSSHNSSLNSSTLSLSNTSSSINPLYDIDSVESYQAYKSQFEEGYGPYQKLHELLTKELENMRGTSVVQDQTGKSGMFDLDEVGRLVKRVEKQRVALNGIKIAIRAWVEKQQKLKA